MKHEETAAEVKVHTSPATTVRQSHHTQRRIALPETLNVINAGRRDTSRVATGQRKKGNEQNQGSEKNAEIGKIP